VIILTNCLTQTPDEGALKVANSMIRRIKERRSDVKVVSYERKTSFSDRHLSLNKLMINPALLGYLQKSDEDVLYIPFPAGMMPIFLRTFILSLFVKKRLKVLLMMQGHINPVAKLLMRISRAQTFSLSEESFLACERIIGERAHRIKAGVDTDRYQPVSSAQKAELRKKYGIPVDSVVALHVGHMKEGRNIQQLLKLDEKIFVLVVMSTYTESEQDTALRQRLEQRGSMKIIDTFLTHIEEIYQLSDVYLFPVESRGNCIDAPLSAFEAASCSIPVVHTRYAELTQLCGKDGFYTIESFDADHLNRLVVTALSEKKNPRDSILEYDWNRAIDSLCG